MPPPDAPAGADAAAPVRDPDDAVAACCARWHLAVVGGPDPGWCHPVRPRPRTLGRGAACDLTLDDPGISRSHLAFRERGRGVEIRDLGSANGTRIRRAGRRRGRRVRRRWRRVPATTEILVGASVLRVRPRPGLAGHAHPPATPTASGLPATAAASGHPPASRWPSALLGAAWFLPLLLAPGLSGARAALLALPLLLIVPAAWSHVRERRAARAAFATGRGPDPAAVLMAAVAGDVGGRATHDPTVCLATGVRVDPLADGPIALVGSPAVARAAARWVTCQVAVRGAALAVDPRPAGGGWAWLDGLPSAAAASDRTLVLADLLDGDPPAAPLPARSGIILVPTLARVPPACRHVVEVPDDDPHLVSGRWARRVAAAVQAASRAAEGGSLPRDVRVEDLLADPALAWPAHDGGLAAAFAVGSDGPVTIDLARDGPHALVAGTTGAGKSELLACWILALACAYPPSALTVVAIDYKGGATFAPVADLPHVAAVLTDLDAAGTARALAGLRAELARRERVLAAAGARDLAEFRRRRGAGTSGDAGLGRLLVVVDEFRALIDEHPDLLAGLVRLAAQGRSLGMHLVLATQRPAGAIGPDLRANIRLAVCLRVVGPADSLDVLGTADAARLPAVPGRAIVVADARSEVQAAWCGPDAAATISAVRARVDAACRVRHERPAAPLWPPPLPVRAWAPSEAGSETAALPLLLLDEIDEQRVRTWAWDPASSPLVIAGPPGSGRSAALATLAAGALARGWAVHVVGRLPDGVPRDHPRLGTVVAPDDPRRLARLVDVLAERASPALVCLDDVDAALAACGSDGLERLVRARAGGVAIAVGGPLGALTARWAATARHRIVLGALDAGQAAVAGVPRGLALRSPPPGRGVLLGDGGPRLGQVLLPGAVGRHEPPGRAPAPPIRLAAIPRSVSPTDVEGPPPDAWSVPIGRGGDDAAVVWLDAGAGARIVVAGPPESGRTSVLAWLDERLRLLGADVLRVDAATPAPLGRSSALLVDDAEALVPEVADAVAARWAAPGGVVVAAIRTDALATAYRGFGALLCQARCAVVLAPLRGGTGHVPAATVLRHADPTDPAGPGLGVLVEPRRVLPVRLVDPGLGRPGATPREQP